MTTCNTENILTSFVYCYIEIACTEPESGLYKRPNFVPKLAIQSNV